MNFESIDPDQLDVPNESELTPQQRKELKKKLLGLIQEGHNLIKNTKEKYRVDHLLELKRLDAIKQAKKAHTTSALENYTILAASLRKNRVPVKILQKNPEMIKKNVQIIPKNTSLQKDTIQAASLVKNPFTIKKLQKNPEIQKEISCNITSLTNSNKKLPVRNESFQSIKICNTLKTGLAASMLKNSPTVKVLKSSIIQRKIPSNIRSSTPSSSSLNNIHKKLPFKSKETLQFIANVKKITKNVPNPMNTNTIKSSTPSSSSNNLIKINNIKSSTPSSSSNTPIKINNIKSSSSNDLMKIQINNNYKANIVKKIHKCLKCLESFCSIYMLEKHMRIRHHQPKAQLIETEPPPFEEVFIKMETPDDMEVIEWLDDNNIEKPTSIVDIPDNPSFSDIFSIDTDESLDSVEMRDILSKVTK